MSKFSVIIPAFNEVENIDDCVRGVVKVMSHQESPFEVIVVDDGSTDGTGDKVMKLIESPLQSVLLVSHDHNLGKTLAIRSGLSKATGDIIVLMDADLQYDPNDIPRLTEMILNGYDAANGKRVDRKDGLSKRTASKFFNWTARLAFHLNVDDFNSGLKAFRRPVLEEVEFRGDYHRYFLAAAKMNGYKIGEAPIIHYPRKYGKSKYGLKRLLLGSTDLVSLRLQTMLSKRPMLLFGSLSATCFLVSIAAGAYSLLTGGVELRPALLLSIAFMLASVQFLSMGFLADLLVDLKHRVNSRYLD